MAYVQIEDSIEDGAGLNSKRELDADTKRDAEEIYNELASIVASDIDDDWATATIHAVIHGDEDVTCQGIYTHAPQDSDSEHDSEHDSEPSAEPSAKTSAEPSAEIDLEISVEADINYFRTQSQVFDLILDLRRLLHDPSGDPFSKVDFTVNRDGEYDLVFS